MQDLGALGGKISVGYGINASGQVVGYAETASPGTVHAYVYSGGKMQDLGTLGGTYSWAEAINASGQVVGLSGTASGQHAFLYSGGKMTDLNSLLPANSGLTLAWASGINDKGQIAAQGSNGHGYLLTPDSVAATPEPGGLTLLALGAAGLLAAYRRRARA
jgi:MYXO-CTERM domain-containing protein